MSVAVGIVMYGFILGQAAFAWVDVEVGKKWLNKVSRCSYEELGVMISNIWMWGQTNLWRWWIILPAHFQAWKSGFFMDKAPIRIQDLKSTISQDHASIEDLSWARYRFQGHGPKCRWVAGTEVRLCKSREWLVAAGGSRKWGLSACWPVIGTGDETLALRHAGDKKSGTPK